MIEVTVKHDANVKFEVAARGHIVVCDQPAENGGADEGITPPEFFLASLGSCAAFYAVAYLKKKNLGHQGVQVRVTAEKVPAPARLDQIHIDVDVAATLSQVDHAGVLDSVHRCLIHNTLLHPPTVSIDLHAPVTA